MLTAIIVDDEQLRASNLKHNLETMENIRVLEVFTYGRDVLEGIKELEPDFIFLDVNTPAMSGIEIADQVLLNQLETEVIFVTAYGEYLIRTFKMGVNDYVIKPIKKERSTQMINRVIGEYKTLKQSDEYTVCSFKYHHFLKNGLEIKNVKWRTAKSRELFIYLVHNSRGIVRKDVLVELFWPDLEAESAYDNLYSNIYNIRNTLKDINVNIDIINTTHGYEVVLNDVKYDVFEWEKLIETLDQLISENGDINHVINLYRKMRGIYKGGYLEEETYIWKENEKERLGVLFMSTSRSVIELLIENQEYTEAILLSLDIQNMYPYLEYSYFMLMKLYDKFGDRYSVENQYNRLKQVFEREFNSSPSAEISSWYSEWLKKQRVT